LRRVQTAAFVMAASISEPLAFEPTARTLAFVQAELDEMGARAGGANEPHVRRAALAAYRNAGRERRAYPARWRYDYASLSFEDLYWQTGRAIVPVLPPVPRKPSPPAEEPVEAAALAVENAGGLVHLGAVYLEPQVRQGDPRITRLALSDAARAAPERVASARHRIIAPDADRFTALATAFQNCGAYVDIPDGVSPGAPLQLVWTSRPGEASAVFPHVVVRVGAGARATIVERHVGDTEAFVCGLVEIDLAAGARLDYVVLQRADVTTRLLFRRAARCAAGASVAFHVAELGGALVRSVVETNLAGADAGSDVDALFFAHGFEHVDLEVDIAHAGSATSSRTIVRDAASGRGQGRFRGGIRIPSSARGCRAAMRDDALVLSRDAYLEAIPALEIAANDVSASHAATVGSLDEEQLFYVQSRGFARGSAERMIALAFFEPAIAGFPTELLRDEVRTALDERLGDIGETFVS
jgi:FeS assembly protein SufD